MRAFLLLFLLAACTTPDEKKEGECKKACDYTMELALADIDKSMAAIGSPEMADKLRAELEGRRESDLKSCMKHCKAGRLDAKCALAAQTIDGALSCTSTEKGGATGKKPIEPPKLRTDAEWPAAEVKEVADTLGGVAFTLRIPTELQENEVDRSDTSRGWDFPDERYSQPRFRVDLRDAFPKTVEEGESPRGKVLRREHTGDRYTLLYKAETYVFALVVVRAGDKGLECSSEHSGSDLTKPDEIGAWLVEVCSTMVVK